MSQSKILVVAATEQEAAHIPSDFKVLITGMGKVAAAVAMAAELGKYPPTDMPLVINIGTCGGLHEHRSGLFTPSIVLNHDFSADVLRKFGHDVVDTLHIPDGDGTVLATGDLFVSDPAARDVLAASADLVDMEGFAIAFACDRVGARCRLVKHVTDKADEAALTWPELIDESARELGEWLAAL
ncbi:nucleosidase [Rhodococcus sp. WMMA185]|uniref:nucleosidase n=1 Tax=Rhodococcus sp. WMMA185 TaxID=679318 RepID=UPI0008789DA5|nr:nucleosidase [Rhodococcus sp. WMMA185]